MIELTQYFNQDNGRKYIVEVGDLFTEHTLTVRYGIGLGIKKTYRYHSRQALNDKIECIRKKRLANGYQELGVGL